MESRARSIMENSGSELTDALRLAVEESTRRYEQQTGSVVTRIEIWRKGSDWCVDVRTMAEVPPNMSDEKFR